MSSPAIPYQALEIIAVSALIPYARNSRTHSETQVGQFAASRKLGKTHQNVLVFVKGDGKAAALACGPVEVEVPDDAGGGAANVNAAPNIAAVA